MGRQLWVSDERGDQLYNYARDTKSEYGLICCNENLGLIYQEIHRDSDAIVAYREGLDLLQKRGDNPRFEMQYMGNLIESYLRTDHFTEAEELLTRYDEMIQDRERENEEQGTAFPRGSLPCANVCFLCGYVCPSRQAQESIGDLVEGDTDRRENRRWLYGILLQLRFRQVLLFNR